MKAKTSEFLEALLGTLFLVFLISKFRSSLDSALNTFSRQIFSVQVDSI